MKPTVLKNRRRLRVSSSGQADQAGERRVGTPPASRGTSPAAAAARAGQEDRPGETFLRRRFRRPLATRRLMTASPTDSSGSTRQTTTTRAARKQQAATSKADKLGVADHDSIAAVPQELLHRILRDCADDQGGGEGASALELDDQVPGKDAYPLPIKTWAQAGTGPVQLSSWGFIRRSGFDKPMPIQCQALPVIMSGRDCIGVAKTGIG